MKTPNWKASAFDGGVAHTLAELAYIAYDEDKERTKQTITYKEEEKGEVKGRFQMDWAQFFRLEDTEALVTYNKNALILSFRGTSSVQDFLTDAKIKLIADPFGKGRIHEGFETGLDKIWKEVWYVIGRKRRNRTIWITGHSLGGALAVTAAARLEFEKNQRIDGLYTFGQPRAGDPAFVDACDKKFGDRYYRFVHNKDIVPRVPTRMMGFEHTGIFKYINATQQLDDTMPWDEITKVPFTQEIRQLLQLGTEGIRDHSMINYVEALSK